jgi:multidrug efflux system outer membrane protein
MARRHERDDPHDTRFARPHAVPCADRRPLADRPVAALFAGRLLQPDPVPTSGRSRPGGGAVSAGTGRGPTPHQTAVASRYRLADFFQDARLKQLIALALENNRDLRVAALNHRAGTRPVAMRRADEVLPIAAPAPRQPRTPNAGGGITTATPRALASPLTSSISSAACATSAKAAQAQLLASEEARKTVQISLIARWPTPT